jgi:isopentenyldiphosphate isomerase
MNANPGDELVDVIDDEGRTIGMVTRREIRLRGLAHRCTYILVFNGRGELFVHLRTATKDVFPSHWDVVVGGVLAAGESFAEGARREMQEELGISVEPGELFLFWYADASTRVQGMVYRVVHDGPFVLQPEEIVRGEFLPLSEVDARSRTAPFCPDALAVLREFRRRMDSGELASRVANVGHVSNVPLGWPAR